MTTKTFKHRPAEFFVTFYRYSAGGWVFAMTGLILSRFESPKYIQKNNGHRFALSFRRKTHRFF